MNERNACIQSRRLTACRRTRAEHLDDSEGNDSRDPDATEQQTASFNLTITTFKTNTVRRPQRRLPFPRPHAISVRCTYAPTLQRSLQHPQHRSHRASATPVSKMLSHLPVPLPSVAETALGR